MGDVRKIHFACTQCGKCCDFPGDYNLALTFSESIKFSSIFPIVMAFEFPTIPSTREWEEHARTTLGDDATLEDIAAAVKSARSIFEKTFFVVRQGFHEIGLRLFIRTFPSVNGKCQALKDNLCSIHQDRPLACKIFPIPMYTNPNSSMFDAWKKTTGPGRGNYECTVDESAPIIASLEDDNTISINDSEIAEAREKSLDHYVKNKEFTRKIMDRYRLHDTNWMRAKSTGTPHFSIAAVLKIATDENILSESEALEVAKKQRDVMFRRINAAVDARISSQKQETSMLRKLMQEVDAYIENVKER